MTKKLKYPNKKTMYTKYIILVFLFSLFFQDNYGQYTLKNESDVQWYMNIPQEKVFIHYNTNLLITGEYFYYKFYCLNSNTNQLSQVSKIGYVTLINEHGESIFTKKIKLDKGLGYGEYFIPSSIPSGNFKLVAYTQWMRNAKKNQFYSSNITIINPFQQEQQSLLTKTSNLSTLEKPKPINSSTVPSNTINSKIKLSTNFETYKSRTKIKLRVEKPNEIKGNYSISVRKLNPFKDYTSNHYTFLEESNSSIAHKVNDKIYFPELNENVISGKVINKKTNLPAINQEVIISALDKEYLFLRTKTDKQGVYYFNMNKIKNSTNATIQAMDTKENLYKIDFNTVDFNTVDYGDLIFGDFSITSEMKNMILNRSIHNQIENAYYKVKSDSIIEKNRLKTPSFYNTVPETYVLDDYTRFSTVGETATEILENAWTKKNKKGKRVLIVRGREYDPYYGTETLPLVIADGVFIQDHEDIINYDAKKVKNIKVFREEYYYDSKVFKGILFIETFKNDYYKNVKEDHIAPVTLFQSSQKIYFNQMYNELQKSKTDHIPDFRHQLLWIPKVNLSENTTDFDFFSSDVNGIFEIVLEGFTSQGKPISIRKNISVE